MIQVTYTSVETLEDAKQIARILVQEKLAACVNISPHILSVYVWKENLQESYEHSLLIKCSPKSTKAMLSRLRQIHPYELPAIWTLQAETTAEYESWITRLL